VSARRPGMRRALADDRGITLVELVIYSMILAVVVAAVGSMTVAGLAGQRSIGAAGSAASEAQVVTESITNGVRTAAFIAGPTAVPGVGTILATTTASFPSVSSVEWECRAWLATTDGRLFQRTAEATGPIAPPASLDDAALTGWILLAEGVSPVAGSTEIFGATTTKVAVRASIAGRNDGTPTIVDVTATRDTLPSFATLGANPCE